MTNTSSFSGMVFASAFAALFAWPVDSEAADPCRDGARAANNAAQEYRRTTRTVSKDCSGISQEACSAAELVADTALTQLIDAHQTMLDSCEATTPPDPGPGPGFPLPTRLIITEIMADPGNVDDSVGEWFEVLNPTAETVDLQGLTVRQAVDADDSFLITQSVVVPPAGLVVLGVNGDPNANGGTPVDFVYSGFTLSNANDSIQIWNGGLLLDEVAYNSTSFPLVPGAALNLDPGSFDEFANDVSTNWCAAENALPSGDFGTPGAANTNCP